jgi:hypothetical protein
MAVDVATYLAKLDDKKGKLERWETDIFQLHRAGVSYQNISDFLKLNGVESTKMEVYRFIHRKKRRHLLVDKPATSIEALPASSESPETPGPPPEPEPEQKTERQDKPVRPKFSFRERMGKDKTNW